MGIKKGKLPKSEIIKPIKVPEGNISFNFKHLQEDSEKFKFSDKDGGYFCLLLNRLKELGSRTKKEIITNIGLKEFFRHHEINFAEERVSEDSFGLNLGKDAYDDAWQFMLTSNEHGRFHGYYIGNVFYIVWLDPAHNLYPGNK